VITLSHVASGAARWFDRLGAIEPGNQTLDSLAAMPNLPPI
jgi:hypothetical protein